MNERIRPVDVNHCARCGQDHLQLEFKAFNGLPIEDADGVVWDWWGVCPVTGDPVFLRNVVSQPEIDVTFPIKTLGLDIRIVHALEIKNIRSISDVLAMLKRGTNSFLAMRNFGEKSLNELLFRLFEKGYLTNGEFMSYLNEDNRLFVNKRT